jgi:predicted nucleic acid-binding protein
MKAAATKQFVLDASVAVAWCFEDEATKFTEGVLDLFSTGAEALVPSIWPLEIANALLVAGRRKRIALAQVAALLQRIAGLPISIMPVDAARAFEQILSVARQQELSEYDASILNWHYGRGCHWPRLMWRCGVLHGRQEFLWNCFESGQGRLTPLGPC